MYMCALNDRYLSSIADMVSREYDIIQIQETLCRYVLIEKIIRSKSHQYDMQKNDAIKTLTFIVKHSNKH